MKIEIQEQLLYSQRCHVERLVNKWFDENKLSTDLKAFNVITALDSLGLLDRNKVREDWISSGRS